MADGLLDIHVLPGLACPDGRQSMPVVAGRNGYRIDVAVFEHAAQVLLECGPLAGQRFKFAHPIVSLFRPSAVPSSIRRFTVGDLFNAVKNAPAKQVTRSSILGLDD